MEFDWLVDSQRRGGVGMEFDWSVEGKLVCPNCKEALHKWAWTPAQWKSWKPGATGVMFCKTLCRPCRTSRSEEQALAAMAPAISRLRQGSESQALAAMAPPMPLLGQGSQPRSEWSPVGEVSGGAMQIERHSNVIVASASTVGGSGTEYSAQANVYLDSMRANLEALKLEADRINAQLATMRQETDGSEGEVRAEAGVAERVQQ